MLQAYICYEWVNVNYVENNHVVIIDEGGFPNLYPIDVTRIRLVNTEQTVTYAQSIPKEIY